MATVVRNEFNPAIFKAYDVRGKYPDEINEAVVEKIAKGLARHWQIANRKSSRLRIVIGHDARLSSPSLYRAVRRALAAGRRPLARIDAGMITTPMLYFLVNRHRAVGGIMVTASHNPKNYNGIKAVGRGAVPISGTELLRLTEKHKA